MFCKTTGASHTPGCSTATLFSSSAHPLVGLIKKPSADWTETRSGLRSRHTSSTRWSIAAHLVKKFSVVPWFWQRQRETRARERERERERERSVVSERRDGGPRVRERSLTSDEYVLISREGRALQEEEVRTAQVLRHGREAPRSQSQVAAQPLP